ncbi:hypothetical protein WCE02_05930 [Pseudomonas juntendi]|uniref:Uncharacterized protein n=1 Tax=Pseudomonas putida TaxID=303 RepID=A0A1X0ZYM8_PSEPU|nr:MULTISPECIES: hypothetical protein [Pseudomonas]EKT4524554.1 hypothetical protein [Pseudomonas putida]MEB3900684.1 hypothetical protein [Pseudomonas putida]ORL64989.1 hypothetical protein B7H17_09670 [Pseudomonas putida]UBM27121.1 hypothetical protein K8374_09265 [Pseudomonas sp. p1(2021b)]
MTSVTPSPANTRVVRPKLFWRLVFAQVYLLAIFLYLSLAALGGYLLMLGFDGLHPQPQRTLALAGGAVIVLVCLWLLKVAMPRRLGPKVIEREI